MINLKRFSFSFIDIEDRIKLTLEASDVQIKKNKKISSHTGRKETIEKERGNNKSKRFKG